VLHPCQKCKTYIQTLGNIRQTQIESARVKKIPAELVETGQETSQLMQHVILGWSFAIKDVVGTTDKILMELRITRQLCISVSPDARA
jgi:hypothetical protein